MNEIKIKQEKFLNQLNILLKKSYQFYIVYLNSGNKFLHTLSIKEINKEIYNLVLKNIYLFKKPQKSDLFLIINHLESWLEQWRVLYDSTNPKNEDRFVFESKIKFPRNSLARMNNYYYINFNKQFSI